MPFRSNREQMDQMKHLGLHTPLGERLDLVNFSEFLHLFAPSRHGVLQ